MIDESTSTAGASFRAFLSALRRRWMVIAACLIVVPAAAFAYTRVRQPQYKASATILLTDQSFGPSVAGGGIGSPSDQATNIGTGVDLASLDIIARRTAQALGGPYARGGLPGSVAVTSSGTSNVLTVTATEASPALAAQVANTYGHQYIRFRADLGSTRISDALDDVTKQIETLTNTSTFLSGNLVHPPAGQSFLVHPPAGQSSQSITDQLAAVGSALAALRQRASELSTLAALQDGNAQFTALATKPSSSSSPRTAPTVLAGIALGLLLGVMLVVLFEALDRRLRRPADVQGILDGPILGAIPRSTTIADTWGHDRRLRAIDRESFAMVYANMSHFNDDHAVRSVVVTSATGGDGKSTVAWNLAVSGTRAGAKVLLIEADMRRPTIAARIGVRPSLGLSDVLESDYELNEVVHMVSLDEQTGVLNGNGHGNHSAELAVVFAGALRDATNGAPVTNTVGLLSSERMRDLVTAAESEYDLVVIDTPPIPVVSDAIPLVRYASGVVVVMRVNNTREDALHLREQLQNLRARTLGVVVNGVDPADSYYGSTSSYLSD